MILRDGPRDFGAACIGHHAEGAEFVAAFLNGDERRDAPRANGGRLRRRQKSEFVLGGELGLQRVAVLFGAGEQFRQVMIALRADHDVNHGCPVDDLLALSLRHTAGDGDVHAAPLARGFVFCGAEPTEFGIHLLGSLLADVAGVEDDEIGLLDTGGLDKALASQRVHHALRIVDVHLTAI